MLKIVQEDMLLRGPWRAHAERLRASLRDLQVRRDGMSNPGMFEVDTHNIFLNGSAFQETLQALQT